MIPAGRLNLSFFQNFNWQFQYYKPQCSELQISMCFLDMRLSAGLNEEEAHLIIVFSRVTSSRYILTEGRMLMVLKYWAALHIKMQLFTPKHMILKGVKMDAWLIFPWNKFNHQLSEPHYFFLLSVSTDLFGSFNFAPIDGYNMWKTVINLPWASTQYGKEVCYFLKLLRLCKLLW